MPVDPESKRLAFARLSRNLSKLSSNPQPESIHRSRTYSRRLESLLSLAPKHDGNAKKLLKSLKHLRKKAGRVRDLDVQIAALRGLRISRAPAGKSQLLNELVEDRARGLRKLEKSFDKEATSELRKRLRRAEKDLSIPADIDPVAEALRLFSKVDNEAGVLTERRLHQYRIAGKRARYLAELAGDDNKPAQTVVDQLKRMQDIIGDWHDWLELSARAEKLQQEDENSPLVVALRNINRAKFRQAVQALTEARKSLSPPAPLRKASSSTANLNVAVA
jgi:CHAD domain-containing protein